MSNELATSAKITERRVVHDDRWVTAEQVDVEFSNGKKMPNFLMLETKSGGYVLVCGRTVEGQFILVRQYKMAAGMSLEAIAGGKEEGETWEEAAAREFAEEAGYDAEEFIQFGGPICPQTDRIKNPVHIFLAQNCTPTTRLAGDEVQGQIGRASCRERV